MNIAITEQPFLIEAKTTSDYHKKKIISYTFVESYHSLCLNKVEIISAQIQACERLLRYSRDESDVSFIEKEMLELKFALDLIDF